MFFGTFVTFGRRSAIMIDRILMKMAVVTNQTITKTTLFDFYSRRSPIDCRVRFLSFLGIGKDSRKCAFIVHTAQDTFVSYVFHCEPHSGPLCKSIEAACTLRYQKCLDARPQRLQSPSPLESSGKKCGDREPAKQSHTTIKKALKTIFFGSST